MANNNENGGGKKPAESRWETLDRQRRLRNRAANREGPLRSAAAAAPTDELITYGPRNNFSTRKRKLLLAATVKWGMVADCLLTGAYPDPLVHMLEEHTVAAQMARGIPEATAQEILKSIFLQRIKLLIDMESKKAQLFSWLLEQLSTASYAAVREDPDFVAADRTKDPIEVWRIIVRNHRTGFSQSNAVLWRLETRKALQTARQGLKDYLKRTWSSSKDSYNLVGR